MKKLPMRHDYDAGTWVADIEHTRIWVERDAMRTHEEIVVTYHDGPPEKFPTHLTLSLDEAKALHEMLGEAINAIPEEA